MKKAKPNRVRRIKKPRVTKASLKRDLNAAQVQIEDLSARLHLANKERIDFFHKIGRIEATSVEMRGEAQLIADITRTLLGRQDLPPPPMTNMMVVTQR